MGKRLIAIMTAIAALFSCHTSKTVAADGPDKNQKEMKLNDIINEGRIDLMTYEHNDGSIPADIRRGYSIRVYTDSVKVHIWSWHSDDVDITKVYPASPDTLQHLLESLQRLDVRKVEPDPNVMTVPGTGGSDGYMSAWAGEECLFSAGAYFCHGLYGNLQMNSNYEGDVVSLFHRCVPDDVYQMVEESRLPREIRERGR